MMQKLRQTEETEKIRDSFDKNLDLRDQWAGIENLKKDHKPLPYTFKDENGKRARQRRAIPDGQHEYGQ